MNFLYSNMTCDPLCLNCFLSSWTPLTTKNCEKCKKLFEEERTQKTNMNKLKRQTQCTSCDDCKHYHWYYDYCDKWNCEMDARACNSCFEARKTEKMYKLMYHVNCKYCGHIWWSINAFPQYCPKCKTRISEIKNCCTTK